MWIVTTLYVKYLIIIIIIIVWLILAVDDDMWFCQNILKHNIILFNWPKPLFDLNY